MKLIKLLMGIFLALFVGTQASDACTRVVYLGPNNTVLTGRTMDWLEDSRSNMWLFPRGIERNGDAGTNPVKWVSKYGSIVVTAYDIASIDGMNEKGLAGNLLWLAESEYPVLGSSNKPAISMSYWLQYVLDNYATVDEAVKALEQNKFDVITTEVPGLSKTATMHLSISDPTGDGAIFQYIKGKLVIYHGRQYQVMTNSPTFDQQIAINRYWEEIGGNIMLPGTHRSADRFARASFYIDAVTQTDNVDLAAAIVFSVMRNVSVPIGVAHPTMPNIASTIWTTVLDHKTMRYYFESDISPNIFWVDFKDIDFAEKTPVKKLQLTGGKVYAGNAADKFVAATPFKFLEIK